MYVCLSPLHQPLLISLYRYLITSLRYRQVRARPAQILVSVCCCDFWRQPLSCTQTVYPPLGCMYRVLCSSDTAAHRCGLRKRQTILPHNRSSSPTLVRRLPHIVISQLPSGRLWQHNAVTSNHFCRLHLSLRLDPTESPPSVCDRAWRRCVDRSYHVDPSIGGVLLSDSEVSQPLTCDHRSKPNGVDYNPA